MAAGPIPSLRLLLPWLGRMDYRRFGILRLHTAAGEARDNVVDASKLIRREIHEVASVVRFSIRLGGIFCCVPARNGGYLGNVCGDCFPFSSVDMGEIQSTCKAGRFQSKH